MTQDAKSKSRVAFDRQAPLYDSTRFGRHARWLAADVLAEVGGLRPESLLDAGCRTGALLEAVAAALPGTKLYGIDLSPEMVAVARQRLGQIAVVTVADAETLPLPDGAADTVTCVDSFHHYPRPDAALRELRRVIRPGGSLILAEWRLPTPLRGVMNSFIHHLPEDDVRVYSRKELCRLTAAAGFGELRWRKAGRRGQLLVGRR
jgi:ubiquinone/menaquinone biosynthesis C-methylase UbiE